MGAFEWLGGTADGTILRALGRDDRLADLVPQHQRLREVPSIGAVIRAMGPATGAASRYPVSSSVPMTNSGGCAVQVIKVLNGTKPSDIPIEQPSKFKLIINAKTAEALGLILPLSLLASASEVIE